MDEIKKESGVLYVDTTKAFLYTSTTRMLTQIDFPAEIFRDLEIVQKDKFSQLFMNFFQQQANIPTIIFIILSPLITFEIEFAEILLPSGNKEIQTFLESVPFEEVISKTYRLNKKTKVVAANKELCDEITILLENVGSKVIAIIPFTVIQEIEPTLLQNLDLGVILNKSESLKQYTLMTQEETLSNKPAQKNPEKKRFFALIATFTVLLIILIALLFKNGLL